nr:Hypothetical protein FSTVLC9_377 [Faustovirus]
MYVRAWDAKIEFSALSSYQYRSARECDNANKRKMNKDQQGQLLIDIASQIATETGTTTVAQLVSETLHRYHRGAVYAAVMCDNIRLIRQLVDVEKPLVQCCALNPPAANRQQVPDILRVDQRNTLTMTCVEYDAIECFKYLHKITNETLDAIIAKAILYGAQKILTHLAATTDRADYIVMEARKKGLQLRICV